MEGHVVAVSVLMLVGVPTNAVVIWIHTRSKSHLTHNKFPLIFATIDLVAIVLFLPLVPVAGEGATLSSPLLVLLHQVTRVLAYWIMNAYFATLVMASLGKLYAITSPFGYRNKRELFVKIALFLAGPIDLAVSSVLGSLLRSDAIMALLYIYDTLFLIMFLTTILLYVIIVVRIIQSERSMHNKVQPDNRM